MNTITKIGVHHFGGTKANPTASTQHLTLEQIESVHRAQWPDFRSYLKSFIGYNEIIFPNGNFVQTRLIGEETAAVIGANKSGFYPCLAGNFTIGVDKPTGEQKETLRKHLKACLTNDVKEIEKVGLKVLTGTILQMSLAEIKPHRVLHPNHTECYGNALPDDWARKLATENLVKEMQPNGYTVTKYDTPSYLQVYLYYLKHYEALFKKKPVIGAVGERECSGLLDLT